MIFFGGGEIYTPDTFKSIVICLGCYLHVVRQTLNATSAFPSTSPFPSLKKNFYRFLSIWKISRFSTKYDSIFFPTNQTIPSLYISLFIKSSLKVLPCFSIQAKIPPDGHYYITLDLPFHSLAFLPRQL